MNVRDDRDAHRRRATVSQLIVFVTLAAGWIVAGAILWQTEVPSLDLAKLEAEDFFLASELDRSEEHKSLTRPLWAGATALELVVLGLLVWRARSLAGWVRRWARGRVRTGIGVLTIAALLLWLVGLPLEGVAHWWRRRFGLSEQGYWAWLGDAVLEDLVRAVLVAVVLAGAMVLAIWLGKRWWIVGAPAVAALGVLFVLAQPLVIQPLFNRFEPLPDGRLAGEVQELARRLDVQIETVQVTDASRRTTTGNAFVAGVGPTRRMVFFDTLFDGRFAREEILSIAAHELAHVQRRHVWKAAAWFALIVIPGVYLVARLSERQGGLRDPAAVPLALLAMLVLFLATLPLQNVVSRRYEAEADWLMLQATRDPDGATGLFRRLSLSSLGDPSPPGWVTVWLRTHPSTMERIAMAFAFEARAARPAGEFSGRTRAGS